MPQTARRAGALAELRPSRIVKQICLLQAAYYAVAFVLILFTTLVAGERFGLALLFDWRSVRGDTTVGWTLGLCWMMDAAVGVIFLLVLVSRSKLVPDFALTIHFLHFVATSLYSHALPTNYLWWGLQACSAAVMISLGIWTCQWRELQPIDFGAKADGRDGLGGAIAGLVGRNSNDQRGTYEMVGMTKTNIV